MRAIHQRSIAVGDDAIDIPMKFNVKLASESTSSIVGPDGAWPSRGRAGCPTRAEDRSGAGVNEAGVAMRSFERPAQELVDELKAYLVCRASGVNPPTPLVAVWEQFYGYYAPRIRTFLKRWALSEADRNDCFQEFWQEVVAGLRHFTHDPARACLSTWLMTLARNKAVDAIRRQSRHVCERLGEDEAMELTDPGPDPAVAYERSRIRGQVHNALAELSTLVSPTSFQVLYLRWIEGRTTSEVAHALNLTCEQVRFRTHRMKRRIRDLLERSMVRDTHRGDEGKNGRARNGSALPGE